MPQATTGTSSLLFRPQATYTNQPTLQSTIVQYNDLLGSNIYLKKECFNALNATSHTREGAIWFDTN
jgi:hypothetical protein